MSRIRTFGLVLAGLLAGIIIALALTGGAIERNWPRPILTPYILAHEGGWSNHKSDRGGVTLEGIIQRVYDPYRDEKARPRRALVPEMRRELLWISERNEIYQTKYWLPCVGDKLPSGVDYSVVDMCVNAGIKQSSKHLRRALNLPEDEWRITPDVLIQVRRTHIPSLLRDLNAIHVRFYRGLCEARPSQCDFINGWLDRARTRLARSLVMNDPRASGFLPPADLKPAFGPGKAFDDDEDGAQ